MRREAKNWERRVRKHFDFLLDHGFAFCGVDDSSFWETGATYLGGRVGIEVVDSRETNRVEIDLIRLHEGRLPEPQIWVTDEPINRTLLDNVIEARRHPSLSRESRFTSAATTAEPGGRCSCLRATPSAVSPATYSGA